MNKLVDFGYKKASLEITNICNFKCLYCPYPGLNAEPRQMKKEDVFRAIDDLAEVSVGKLEYLELNVLGEPLIHKDLIEIIDYSRRKKIKIKLVTNGSLFTRENIDAILKAQPYIIKISLELLNDKYFESLRGSVIAFDKYLQNIIDLIDARMKYGNSIPTSIQMDVFYIPELYKKSVLGMAAGKDITKYIYKNRKKLLNDVSDFLDRIKKRYPEIAYSKEGLISNFNKIKKLKFSNDVPLFKISENIFITLKEYFHWVNVDKKIPAYSGRNGCMVDKIGILSDGKVVLCCLDYDGKTQIGNIFEHSLGDILSGSQKCIDRLRSGKFDFDRCAKCKGYFSRRHKFFKQCFHNLGINRESL